MWTWKKRRQAAYIKGTIIKMLKGYQQGWGGSGEAHSKHREKKLGKQEDIRQEKQMPSCLQN